MCSMPNMYKLTTVKANAQKIVTWKMHLALKEIITLNANAKKIITLKYIWHHICAKLLLCRQMLRKSSLENAF